MRPPGESSPTGRSAGRQLLAGCLSCPALLMYAVFVLQPLALTIKYSFYKWNGVGSATWVGLKNYINILQVPNLIGTIYNAFWLVVWFSFIPVGLRSCRRERDPPRCDRAASGAVARTVLFLPQVIPLVAAGIIWGWLLALPGLINQIFKAVGLRAHACLARRLQLGTPVRRGDRNLGAAGILHCTADNRHGEDRPGSV